jgi:hypothetical protein
MNVSMNTGIEGVAVNDFAQGTHVTREMVYARTRELAAINGRSDGNISQDDYEQAKRELTGERDLDRQEAMLAMSQQARRYEATHGRERPSPVGGLGTSGVSRGQKRFRET